MKAKGRITLVDEYGVKFSAKTTFMMANQKVWTMRPARIYIDKRPIDHEYFIIKHCYVDVGGFVHREVPYERTMLPNILRYGSEVSINWNMNITFN
jgi:hypothetical protein